MPNIVAIDRYAGTITVATTPEPQGILAWLPQREIDHAYEDFGYRLGRHLYGITDVSPIKFVVTIDEPEPVRVSRWKRLGTLDI
jgi:hypothetical protein